VEVTEQQLWNDYRRGCEAARDQLLDKYLPFAKHVAAALYAKRAVNDIEFGDYLHLAYIGLLEAMQRYRHEANAQFTTFASYRIRGAVLNGIPRMTEVGDQIAYAKRVQAERTASLQRGEKKVPADLSGMLELVVGIALTYQIDELLEAEEPNLQSPTEPYGSRTYDEMQQRLRKILKELPEREQQIVRYHYFHHMAFDEIARLLAISKSRTSQLHKRAIDTIREALRKSRLLELY
jgi:RNA polymerase sigma factor for flagellar operon FliA